MVEVERREGNNLRVQIVIDSEDAKRALEEIGVDSGGVRWMAPKALHYIIKVKKLGTPAALILKQEMLSRGGEAAVSRKAGNFSVQETDVLLMGVTRCRFPVAWLGSTTTGRWLNLLTSGTALKSRVLRVAFSKVRIPRSQSTTFSFPSATMYSAAISHSSMVAEKPRFNRTGLPERPTARSRLKFCMKLTTLEKVKTALEMMEPQVEVDPGVAERARRALERMLEIS